VIGFSDTFKYENSLIIGRVGAYCGSISLEHGKYWATDNAIVANVSDEHELRFIYNLLKAFPLNSLAGGSAQPLVNQTILSRITAPLPDKPTQRKIAALLSAYDDLIETNQRRIVLLERMAEEIYREWFVRLRFPGHEKTKFVKGVPVGWEVRKLGSVLELRYGRALKEENRIPGPYAVYGSSGVVGWHNEAHVQEPGIVVGRKGNVGSVFISDGGFFVIDTAYFVVSELPRPFLLHLLRSQNFINNDSAVPGLNRDQAYSIPVFLPAEPLLKRFELMASPIFESARLLRAQNNILTRTRDLLLPRLISGKLRVDDLDVQFPPSMADAARA
jgi:type I restriction enzyme S subunit